MKSILMMVCGAFCVLGGVAHSALGLPELHRQLAATNMPPELAKEIGIFWVFMGAAMATFGGILVTCGLRMRKKDYSGSAMAMWVAACLILYDTVAMIWYGKFEPHFLAFVAVGAIIVFAALPGRKGMAS